MGVEIQVEERRSGLWACGTGKETKGDQIRIREEEQGHGKVDEGGRGGGGVGGGRAMRLNMLGKETGGPE